MYEHRLLMLQVQGAMVRAGEKRMVGRVVDSAVVKQNRATVLSFWLFKLQSPVRPSYRIKSPLNRAENSVIVWHELEKG